jgi:acyl-CoA reductase-like NAD-dependent aldehyde dehydrogenase
MASSASDSPLPQLRASVADGRAQNSRFKQKQLQSLHAELLVQADAICAVMARESPNSAAEVETEFYLTMAALRHFYESIDSAQDLKEEYLVTKGVDNTQRRVGAGLVVIRPTYYTMLYSIICPIAAAIAAGNCILLEVYSSSPKYSGRSLRFATAPRYLFQS